MDDEESDLWYALFNEHHERVKKNPEADLSEEFVGQLSQTVQPVERHILTALILHEARRSGNRPVYDSFAQIGPKEFPDDVSMKIGIAGCYLYSFEEPEMALETVEEGLASARRVGEYQRHAWQTKARIALKLRNLALWEECLREIGKLSLTIGVEDSALERDFVDSAPLEFRETEAARNFLEHFQNYAGRKQ